MKLVLVSLGSLSQSPQCRLLAAASHNANFKPLSRRVRKYRDKLGIVHSIAAFPVWRINTTTETNTVGFCKYNNKRKFAVWLCNFISSVLLFCFRLVQSCCFHSTLLLTKGRPSISKKKKKTINTINFTLIEWRTKLISTVLNWMNQIAYNQCSSFEFSTPTFSFHTNSKINMFTCKLKRLRIFCNTVLLFATSVAYCF